MDKKVAEVNKNVSKGEQEEDMLKRGGEDLLEMEGEDIGKKAEMEVKKANDFFHQRMAESTRRKAKEFKWANRWHKV